MKKAVVAFSIILGAIAVKADVITNYVYIVSNIFNNVYSESIITQKVKSTHTDYYFTNYVSIVTNVYQTTFQTNIEVNVIFDNFEPWVNAASNYAANASSFAGDAAQSATTAGASASTAATYANTAWSAAHAAQDAASSTASACANTLSSTVNAFTNWFNVHTGEMVTNVNITTNFYFAEDSVARAGVTNNAIAISTLNEDISTLDGRITTLESDAYVQDPEWGGVYVYRFYLSNASGKGRLKVTIDTVNDGDEKRWQGAQAIQYWNSADGLQRPCKVELLSGTWPQNLYIYHLLSNGKLGVSYQSNYNSYTITTTASEMSPLKLPDLTGTNNYLESFTAAKKKISVWVNELMAGITNRISVLEGFHGISQ